MKTNMFGQSAKVDLESVINDTLATLADIRSSDEEQRRKTQREKRLGAHVRTTLFEDGRKREDTQLKLSTLNGYLSKVRKAITEAGYKHHSFDAKIQRMSKSHPDHSERLLGWLDMTTKDIYADRKELRLELEKSKKANKKHAALWESLDGDKFKIVPEVIKAMKLMDSERDYMRDHQRERITTKAGNSTPLNADKLRTLLIDLFTDQSTECYGLALGISIACCRRQIETCLISDFTPVGKYRMEITNLAKKRGSKAKAIVYTLVEASVIMSALERLRASPRIKKIQGEIEKNDSIYTDNEVFNNWSRPYTAYAKERLADALGAKRHDVEGWVYKDSRSIGAKASFSHEANHILKTEDRVIQESAYFEQAFAHKDKATQDAYKEWVMVGEFKLIDAKTLTGVESVRESERAEYRDSRVDALRELSINASTKSKKVRSIISTLADLVSTDPAISISLKYVKKHVGGKATLIVEAVGLIRDAGLNESA